MTERLYYTDSYLREFQARVVERSADGRTVYLDRTLFYPTSGGQPFDVGVDRRGGGGRRGGRRGAHRAPPGGAARGGGRGGGRNRLDAPLRPHAAALRAASALRRVRGTLRPAHGEFSFGRGERHHRSGRRAGGGAHRDRKPSGAPTSWSPRIARMDVRFEDARAAQGLRKASEREGTLRIVSIDGLDRSACGGTHVRTTGEIGPILLRAHGEDPAIGARGIRLRRARGAARAGGFRGAQQNRAALLRSAGRSGAAGGRATGDGEGGRQSAPQAGTRPGGVSGQGTLRHHRARAGWHAARRAAAGSRQPGRPARGGAELHRADARASSWRR